MAKTNIDHLRDLCSLMPEASEFIDAIEQDFEDLKTDHAYEIKELKDEIGTLEERINDWIEESTEEIDCGIGKIMWSADNLQLKLLMENFGEKIQKHGALTLLRSTTEIPV